MGRKGKLFKARMAQSATCATLAANGTFTPIEKQLLIKQGSIGMYLGFDSSQKLWNVLVGTSVIQTPKMIWKRL